MKCCCCNSELKHGIEAWHFVCDRCGYECSTAEPVISEVKSEGLIDEVSREDGLHSLRKINFKRIREVLTKQRKRIKNDKLLDVGAAHGWFLEEMETYTHSVLGVEPDESVAEKTISRGLPLRIGFFPSCINENESFDIISFNDVFEHIPNAENTLLASKYLLKKNGTLVINLPVSNGLIYKTSKILFLCGIKTPFERMWQINMPSPHLHYFNRRCLELMLKKCGFFIDSEISLSAVSTHGLYKRIRTTNSIGKMTSGAMTIIITILLPLLQLFRNDISCFFIKRTNGN